MRAVTLSRFDEIVQALAGGGEAFGVVSQKRLDKFPFQQTVQVPQRPLLRRIVQPQLILQLEALKKRKENQSFVGGQSECDGILHATIVSVLTDFSRLPGQTLTVQWGRYADPDQRPRVPRRL